MNIESKKECENMNKIIKKNIMSLEEHREMGKTLQKIRNDLIEKSAELERYGKSRLGSKIANAVDLIDHVRSQLEDHMFNENPELDSKEGCRYYY